jgi:hypothetical protein
MSDWLSDGGLTIDLVDKLVACVAQQKLPHKYAALACGVSPTTFEDWLEQGETGTGTSLHIDLAKRIHEADANHVGHTMSNLHGMCEKDPKAAELFLKLLKPGDFGGPKADPDRFSGQGRNKKKRASLLANPPPRMLAEMRQYGYQRLPMNLSKEDQEAINAICAKYLVPQLPEKADEE